MIGSTRQVKVWAYGCAVDLRKGFDGLTALVGGGLGQDPLSGDMFLFVNRRRHLAKVLRWDGTGLCIYSKGLEQGWFACRWRRTGGGRLRLASRQLGWLAAGSTA